MSERERWIVYPLLFFALGAALRDKFTHTVRTDDLHAGQIVCEDLTCKQVRVVDPLNPKRPLAVLTATNIANDPSHRMGSLLLSDSEGQEYFGLADDQLKMRQIVCEGLTIVDPKHPERSLVLSPRVSAEKLSPARPKSSDAGDR